MPRRPIGETAMTGAERIRRYRLKRAATKPATKPNGVDGAALTAELEQAQARIRALEAELARGAAEIARLKAELARERQRHVTVETKAQKPPLTEAERETKAESMIKGLRSQLRKRQAELRNLTEWKNNTGIPAKGGMSRSTYIKIVTALHPDKLLSEEDRAEGCRAFNDWVDSLKSVRRSWA